MQEILDAIIDPILTKLSALPYLVRVFFKILYEEISKKYKEEYGEQKMYNIIADFLICKWLVVVCFFEIS